MRFESRSGVDDLWSAALNACLLSAASASVSSSLAGCCRHHFFYFTRKYLAYYLIPSMGIHGYCPVSMGIAGMPVMTTPEPQRSNQGKVFRIVVVWETYGFSSAEDRRRGEVANFLRTDFPESPDALALPWIQFDKCSFS